MNHTMSDCERRVNGVGEVTQDMATLLAASVESAEFL